MYTSNKKNLILLTSLLLCLPIPIWSMYYKKITTIDGYPLNRRYHHGKLLVNLKTDLDHKAVTLAFPYATQKNIETLEMIIHSMPDSCTQKRHTSPYHVGNIVNLTRTQLPAVLLSLGEEEKNEKEVIERDLKRIGAKIEALQNDYARVQKLKKTETTIARLTHSLHKPVNQSRILELQTELLKAQEQEKLLNQSLSHLNDTIRYYKTAHDYYKIITVPEVSHLQAVQEELNSRIQMLNATREQDLFERDEFLTYYKTEDPTNTTNSSFAYSKAKAILPRSFDRMLELALLGNYLLIPIKVQTAFMQYLSTLQVTPKKLRSLINNSHIVPKPLLQLLLTSPQAIASLPVAARSVQFETNTVDDTVLIHEKERSTFFGDVSPQNTCLSEGDLLKNTTTLVQSPQGSYGVLFDTSHSTMILCDNTCECETSFDEIVEHASYYYNDPTPRNHCSCVKVITSLDQPIKNVFFSSGEQYFVAVTENRFSIVDTEKKSLKYRLKSAPIKVVAFNDRTMDIAISSDDGVTLVLNMSNDVHHGFDLSCEDLCFSPDGNYLAYIEHQRFGIIDLRTNEYSVINDGWDTTYANHRCVFNHDGSLVCLFSTAEEGWNDPGVGYMLRCWNTKDWSEVGSLQSVWSAETNALKRIPAMCVNKANTLVLSCPGDTVDFIKLPLDKTAVSSLTKKQSALAFLMMKNRTPNRTVPKKYKKLFESLPIWLQIQLQPTDD